MALTGLNIAFPIKNANGTSFHNLVLHKAVVDSVVMSLGDKITGDVYYRDNTLAVTMHEYIEYNDVHYVLVNPPTIVREGMASDNSELKGMTKYSFVFYHPMYMLSNFPFTDVAVTSDESKYLSQNKSFSWIGYPDDFIAKLNKNLEGTEWVVGKSSRFPEEKNEKMSEVEQFDKVTIADAIKRGHEIWGVPYVVSKLPTTDARYAQGKRFLVEYGLPSNEILNSNNLPFTFRFGQGVGLKNNSRTPRNNKIITRISGQGSENNIPYGYPQIQWYGDQRWDYTEYEGSTINYDEDGKVTNTPKSTAYPIYKGIVGGAYVKLIKHPFTRTNLMPSIYTQTVFNKVSPYLSDGTANPNYNPNGEIKDYYDAVYSQEYPYANEINLLAPSYEFHEFEDIKPELDSTRELGIVGVQPINNDLTPASDWDDTIDDDGNYKQSYFEITLPQLDFDIYACAAITQEMQINMRSGACVGCTFTVQVDWDDYKKNFYDEDGNFLPNGEQRDLEKYPNSSDGSITIIVQKDMQTFGTLMPNIYQHPASGDLFVILGISLPTSYITNAEQRLDVEMKSYMLENNVHYFDYPLKFDEHFLATHTSILEQIQPNSIIRFMYGNEELHLFVKQLTVKYEEKPLPVYDITLTDNIEVVLNQIGQVTEDVEKLSTLLSALRQAYDKNLTFEFAKKLSKVDNDTAQGLITFLQGLRVGTFNSGLLGTGAMIAPSGHAEFESIFSRSFISTPEFRFNRINVTDGELWCTNGYGTIESVVIGKDENGNDIQNGGLITLHLEPNDYASVAAGDICRGVYNDIDNAYQTATVDDDKAIAAGTSAQEGDGIGFPAKTGFFTSYFYIVRIVKNIKGECQFIYGLRKATTPHPCAFMKFAQYGSFTDSTRRASSYSSSINHSYEMRLQGVSTWQIATANIVSREGWLGDLTVELADHTTRTLQGNGLYVQDNVYFGNAVIQLDPYTLAQLERDLSTYKADFSEYVDVVIVDDTGNVIGGLWTDTELQGGGTERSYRIHSAIAIRRNGVLLTEADDGDDAGTGTYKIYANPINCTCIVENSTIFITGIDNIKDGVAGSSDDTNFDYDAMRAMESCRVDLVIDCEGRTSLTKALPISIKHDSQPYVGAGLTNQFSGVSWNTRTQAYIGLPIVFDMKMWHNDEALDIASINDVSITPSVTGMTVDKAIATLTSGQKVARITISALPESLPLVQELNITCSAVYAGVRYERTLVHTINKSTDTNVYSIIPSVSEVVYNKNTNTLDTNSIDCDVFCDSSNNEHYKVTYANFGTHEIGLFYKKFYTNGTSDQNETEYTGTAVSIDTSVKEVVFYLYKKVGTTVDRTVLHDQQGVPVIADGQDGKGIEYIFITKQSWDGTDADKPTIYDVAADRQIDNYCPYTDAQHTEQWTDEPTGVGANMRWEFQAMRKKVNGVWQPFGEVKYKDHYVVDGVTPYMVDLSNERSEVPCDEHGTVISGATYETSRLIIMKGTSYAFTDFSTITITPTNITCNGNTQAFTLTAAQKAQAQSDGYFLLTPSAITADSATIAVSAVYGNITLVATYKINKSYPSSVIYSLMLSLDTIRKDKGGNIVSTDQTLTIQVKKTVGATATPLTTYAQLQTEGLSLNYDNVGEYGHSLTSLSISTSTLIGNGTWGKINLVNSDDVTVDAERINVVTDGGDGSYYKEEYGRSDSRTEYGSGHIDTSYGTSGWAATAPATFGIYQYIWKRSRLWNPNLNGGLGGWADNDWTYVCQTGKTGEQGHTGRMYYPAGRYDTSKSFPVTDELAPVVLQGSTYYYAKKTVPAGNYTPPNSEYWGAFSNFEAMFVSILFANFASLGSFVIYDPFFLSQYGTLVSMNGSIVVETPINSTNYQTIYTSGSKSAVPYGWFDPTDPMAADAPASGYKFRPTKCIDARTGEEWMALGKVHVDDDGDATIGGFEIGSNYIGQSYASMGYDFTKIYNNGEATFNKEYQSTDTTTHFYVHGNTSIQGNKILITGDTTFFGGSDERAYFNIPIKINVDAQRGDYSTGQTGDLYVDTNGYLRIKGRSSRLPEDVNPMGMSYLRKITSNETLTANDDTIIISSSNTITITLPSGASHGKRYTIIPKGVHVLSVQDSNNEAIIISDGNAYPTTHISGYVMNFLVYDAQDKRWYLSKSS